MRLRKLGAVLGTIGGRLTGTDLADPGTLLNPARHLRSLDDAGLRRAVRARLLSVPLGDGRVLCRALGRYKLTVPQDDAVFGPQLLRDGGAAFGLMRLLARLLRPGMVAVDAEAGFGYPAVLMADLVGQDGRLHAAEGDPDRAGLLRRNLSINGLAARCTVHEATASSLGELMFPASAPGPHKGRRLPPPLPVRRLASLDDLVPGRADLLRLPANGWVAAWAGMQGLIGRSPGLMVLLPPAAERDAAWLRAEAEPRFRAQAVLPDGTLARPRAEAAASALLLTAR